MKDITFEMNARTFQEAAAYVKQSPKTSRLGFYLWLELGRARLVAVGGYSIFVRDLPPVITQAEDGVYGLSLSDRKPKDCTGKVTVTVADEGRSTSYHWYDGTIEQVKESASKVDKDVSLALIKLHFKDNVEPTIAFNPALMAAALKGMPKSEPAMLSITDAFSPARIDGLDRHAILMPMKMN